MKYWRLLLGSLLLLTGSSAAQTTGEVTPVVLSGGGATLTLDFSKQDYELILYSTITDEPDTARSFGFTVSGAFAATRPVLLRRPAPVPPSDRDRFETLLRQEEQELAALLKQQGGWRPPRHKIAQAPQIGSTRTFTFHHSGAEPEEQQAVTTLVASSSRALGYLDNALADTSANITTAQIQAMLDRFSDSTYPLITATFGEPSDVDGNGKIIFFFTHRVDRLNNVSGFFASRSVVSTNQGGDGNLADMLFISPTRAPDFYDPLLSHEFQHLVSFNQHVLLRTGDSEEVWLNEALSHIAEDLVNGHVAGGNPDLIETFLSAPENYPLTNTASPINEGRRGVAYLFARGLMETFGADIASRLVKTGRAGVSNVEAETGQNFQDLYQTFTSRIFLSGTGLNTQSAFNYTFPFFTEKTTGRRTLPLPRESGLSATSVSVTGNVKPSASAYLRLMGDDPQGSVTIQTDASGNFRALLIPIPRDFRPQMALAADYFPQLTFNTPLQGQYTSGEAIPISGTVSDPSISSLLISFAPRAATGDTLKFQFDVTGGQFGRSIIFFPTQAGDYDMNFFLGQKGESLPGIGRFSPFIVTAGSDPINLPVDFFPNITFDAPLPATYEAAESVRIAGTLADPAITQLLIRFDPLGGTGDSIRFFVDASGGRFEQTLFFHPTQAGDYKLNLFMGQKGQSLPFVDDVSPITVKASSGAFNLPADLFAGITLTSPLPGIYTAGEGVSLAGTVSDPTVTQILFRFDPKDGGENIRFFMDVVNGQFGQGIVFMPSQGGNYDLVVFTGPKGESLSQAGLFSFVTVNATGSERVSLPVNFFPGLTFDAPVNTSFFSGREVRLTGQMSDASLTQVLFRLDPQGGGDNIRFFTDVSNGQFDQAISFTSAQAGTYELVIFAGLAGQSLSSIGSYGPVEVLAAQAGIDLAQTTLNWGEVGVGRTETQTLVVRNIGSQDLSITGVSLTGPFSAPSTPFTVASGDSATLAVTFAPTSAGSFTETLQLTTNDPTRSTVSVSLAGSAAVLAVPELSLRSTALDFGSTEVGGTVERLFTLVNTGTQTLEINTISGASEPFSTVLPTVTPIFSIAPGDSVQVSVTFTPGAAGDFTGALTIAGNSIPTAQLSLQGSATVAQRPNLTVRQTSLSWQTTGVGTDQTMSLTLVNPGQSDLTLTGLNTEGDAFSIIAVSTPLTLAPGDSTTIIIIFTPTAAGDHTGVLQILSNDPDQPTLQIALSGSATTPSAPSPDFNGDGRVNFSDFLAFAGAFGARSGEPAYDTKFDLDSSGDVGFSDFLTFAAAFGQ